MDDEDVRVHVTRHEDVPFGTAWLLDADARRIGELPLEPGFQDRVPGNCRTVVMSPTDFAIWESWAAAHGIKPVSIH